MIGKRRGLDGIGDDKMMVRDDGTRREDEGAALGVAGGPRRGFIFFGEGVPWRADVGKKNWWIIEV